MFIKKHLRKREPLLSVRFQMVSCLFSICWTPKKRNIRRNPRQPQCVLCSVLVQVNSFEPWSVVTCLCDNRFQGFLNYWPLWGNIYLEHLHPSDAINPEEKLQPENKRTRWLIRSMFCKEGQSKLQFGSRKNPTKMGKRQKIGNVAHVFVIVC